MNKNSFKILFNLLHEIKLDNLDNLNFKRFFIFHLSTFTTFFMKFMTARSYAKILLILNFFLTNGALFFNFN